jgi:hypothetical protein
MQKRITIFCYMVRPAVFLLFRIVPVLEIHNRFPVSCNLAFKVNLLLLDGYSNLLQQQQVG